mmetsp:Transcript_11375/g.23244  ORF Transcript_11375/g.23244 Transcript_11375/m.23244 type:complete len:201 (-) Transcript_11375:3251-3853(-)
MRLLLFSPDDIWMYLYNLTDLHFLASLSCGLKRRRGAHNSHSRVLEGLQTFAENPEVLGLGAEDFISKLLSGFGALIGEPTPESGETLLVGHKSTIHITNGTDNGSSKGIGVLLKLIGGSNEGIAGLVIDINGIGEVRVAVGQEGEEAIVGAKGTESAVCATDDTDLIPQVSSAEVTRNDGRCTGDGFTGLKQLTSFSNV